MEKDLFLACKDGSLNQLKRLKSRRINLKACDEKGNNSLHIAAHYKQDSIIEYLIENKVRINGQTDDGRTPLMKAAASGHLPAVTVLIVNDAKVDLKAYNGLNALHCGVMSGNVKVVEYLVKSHLNVNEQSLEGVTPLFLAAQRGQFKIARVLLLSEADPNLCHNLAASPLHIAVHGKHDEVVEYLIENGARLDAQKNDGKTALHIATEMGYEEISFLLSGKGAAADVADDSRNTPLHNAVTSDLYEAVQCMLFQNPYFIKNNSNQTPLDVAKAKGNREMVNLLQSYYHDVVEPKRKQQQPEKEKMKVSQKVPETSGEVQKLETTVSTSICTQTDTNTAEHTASTSTTKPTEVMEENRLKSTISTQTEKDTDTGYDSAESRQLHHSASAVSMEKSTQTKLTDGNHLIKTTERERSVTDVKETQTIPIWLLSNADDSTRHRNTSRKPQAEQTTYIYDTQGSSICEEIRTSTERIRKSFENTQELLQYSGNVSRTLTYQRNGQNTPPHGSLPRTFPRGILPEEQEQDKHVVPWTGIPYIVTSADSNTLTPRREKEYVLYGKQQQLMTPRSQHVQLQAITLEQQQQWERELKKNVAELDDIENELSSPSMYSSIDTIYLEHLNDKGEPLEQGNGRNQSQDTSGKKQDSKRVTPTQTARNRTATPQHTASSQQPTEAKDRNQNQDTKGKKKTQVVRPKDHPLTKQHRSSSPEAKAIEQSHNRNLVPGAPLTHLNSSYLSQSTTYSSEESTDFKAAFGDRTATLSSSLDSAVLAKGIAEGGNSRLSSTLGSTPRGQLYSSQESTDLKAAFGSETNRLSSSLGSAELAKGIAEGDTSRLSSTIESTTSGHSRSSTEYESLTASTPVYSPRRRCVDAGSSSKELKFQSDQDAMSSTRVKTHHRNQDGNSDLSGHLLNEEGIYYMSNITISNPNNMDGVSTSITITSKPLTEKEFHISDKKQILSEMITLEPHDMVFKKHLLVKFPINQDRYRSDQDVYLMYSDGSYGDDKEMNWVNISQNSTPPVHKDEMFWFINHGFCYLFIRHFCHIFLLQTSKAVTPQSGIYLLVSVYGKYVNEKLIITVGFHCDICFANLLEEKGKFGTLLADKYFCVYDGQGYITTHMAVDNNNGWESSSNEEQIDADQLLPLCQHRAIYHNKVQFRSIMSIGEEVKIDVKVSQGRTARNFSVTTFLKDITEQAKANVEVMTDFQEITDDLASSINHSAGAALPQTTTAKVTGSCAGRDKLEPEVKVSAAQNNIEPYENNQQAVGESQIYDMSYMGDLLNCPDEFNNNGYIPNDHSPTGIMTTTNDLCTKPKQFNSSKPGSDISVEPCITLCQTQDNQKHSRDNRTLMLQGNNMNKVFAIPGSQILQLQPYMRQQNQGCQQIQGNNIQGLAVNPLYVQYKITYNQTSNDSSLHSPETDCVFSRSVASEQEKLCDIMDCNDCKAQLAEIVKEMGDTNGTVDMKNITALPVLQVWKIHVKEGKCSWRGFYDLLVRLGCQSAAQQLKVVCDKDSLVKGVNKLKQDISLDIELCGFLLEKDVIDLTESDEISLKQSPLEKINFLVLELLVKRPDNYWRVKGFFQALHSMRHYSEYVRGFMLCPEDLDEIE